MANSIMNDFAEQSHQYNQEYIRNADQKAIFYFTICSGLLAFLQTQHASVRWLKKISLWSTLDGITFLAMFGLAIAAFAFLLVIRPRLKGSRRGLIYFNAIAEYQSSEEYVSDILKSSDEVLIRAKLQHTYELTKICKTKYQILNRGLCIAFIGILATLIYLLFS